MAITPNCMSRRNVVDRKCTRHSKKKRKINISPHYFEKLKLNIMQFYLPVLG